MALYETLECLCRILEGQGLLSSGDYNISNEFFVMFAARKAIVYQFP